MRVFFNKVSNNKNSMTRILIAALGNPGNEYKKNRHNAGSIILGEIVKTSFLTQIELNNKCVIDTISNFSEMNTSGEKLAVFIKKTTYDLLIVLVDDLETQLGNIKQVYPTIGHKGQNGIRNIIKCCGTDFCTIRIGIGRPSGSTSVNEFVLSNFSQSEMQEVLSTVENAKISIQDIILSVINSKNQ